MNSITRAYPESVSHGDFKEIYFILTESQNLWQIYSAYSGRTLKTMHSTCSRITGRVLFKFSISLKRIYNVVLICKVKKGGASVPTITKTERKSQPRQTGIEKMIHRFKTTSEVAHALTKAREKEYFYFRTLSRTVNVYEVFCEVSERGYNYIKEHGLKVKWEREQ